LQRGVSMLFCPPKSLFLLDEISPGRSDPAPHQVTDARFRVPAPLTTADESPQNSPATVLIPASLGLQILQRHLGCFWNLTPPIQAGCTPFHSSAASEPLHRQALSLRSVPPSRIVGDRLFPAS
jgi:hypothetical protein